MATKGLFKTLAIIIRKISVKVCTHYSKCSKSVIATNIVELKGNLSSKFAVIPGVVTFFKENLTFRGLKFIETQGILKLIKP